MHSTDDNGKEKTETAQLTLPPDLANGIVPIMLKNLPAETQAATLSMVVATPKPMLVKLAVTAQGTDAFTTGGASHKATRYNLKVDIGGVKGVLAPLVGKQPPDTYVWILGGSSPMFMKSEGPLAEGTPVWRTEIIGGPVWPQSAPVTEGKSVWCV